MGRKLFTSFDFKGGERNVLQSIAIALATLASGKNEDATAFSLPVSEAIPATATAVAAGTADVQGVAAATGLRLLGYSVIESAGTPAAAGVTLRNGTATGDTAIAQETLALSTGATRWFGPNGIACPLGVFVDRTAGNTTLVLHTAIIV